MTAITLTAIAALMISFGFIRSSEAFTKLDEVRHDRKCEEYSC